MYAVFMYVFSMNAMVFIEMDKPICVLLSPAGNSRVIKMKL